VADGARRRRFPGASTAAGWYARRPFLSLWAFLSACMVAMAILFGWGAGLTLRQHLVVVIATVILALLCTWIICLERDPSDAPDDA
jgi:hypothetical protein